MWKVKLPHAHHKGIRREWQYTLLILKLGTRIRWVSGFTLRPTLHSWKEPSVFPGGKAAGPWGWPPTPSSAEDKEGAELYLYSDFRPTWSVIRWTFTRLKRSWVDPRACLSVFHNIQFFLLPGIKPRVVQPVARHYTELHTKQPRSKALIILITQYHPAQWYWLHSLPQSPPSKHLPQPYWMTPHTTETSHRPKSSLSKLRIGATSFLLDSLTLRMGPIAWPETSVRNYHYSLRNNTK